MYIRVNYLLFLSNFDENWTFWKIYENMLKYRVSQGI